MLNSMYIINLQTAFIAFHIMLVHSLQYMETLPYINCLGMAKRHL